MHLTLGSAFSRGSIIPAQFIWFADGWLGFRFDVSPSGYIVARGAKGYIPVDSWREISLWQQATKMANQIQAVFDYYGGLADAIEYAVAVGWLDWAEDNKEVISNG